MPLSLSWLLPVKPMTQNGNCIIMILSFPSIKGPKFIGAIIEFLWRLLVSADWDAMPPPKQWNMLLPIAHYTLKPAMNSFTLSTTMPPLPVLFGMIVCTSEYTNSLMEDDRDLLPSSYDVTCYHIEEGSPEKAVGSPRARAGGLL
jgi:hypothetical protein